MRRHADLFRLRAQFASGAKQGAIPFCCLLQGSANPRAPGLVNFVTAVAYPFCLNLPEKFSQPWNGNLVQPPSIVPLLP